MYGSAGWGQYEGLRGARAHNGFHEGGKRPLHCCDRAWFKRSTAFAGADTGKRNQCLYPWRNAPGPCISKTEKIFPSQGKLRYCMAESKERIWLPARSHFVYHQLPDAAEGKLCGPGIYHRDSGIPRSRSYWRAQRLYACDRKGAGAERICGR